VTDGGIGAVSQVQQVSITNSDFLNVTTGKIGGVFVFQNIANTIVITNSNFISCAATGSGGAIAFLSGTSFQIIGTFFTSCSSGSYGGALSSSSTETSLIRVIQNTTFSGNSAYQYIGLDIYDSSNIASTLYSRNSMSGSSSTSTAIGSYVLFAVTQVGEGLFIYLFIYFFFFINIV
jgi:hypothetical protein